MTKKRWALAGVCALTSAACLVAAAACGTEKYKFENEKFEYNTEVELTLDTGAEIDGRKNESFYGENGVSFTETNSGVTVTTWAHIGVWGLYLYTETNDKSVYYSDEKNFYENDTVEYYIDPNPAFSFAAVNSDNQVRSDMLQLRINPLGACQTWYGRKTGNYPWVRGRYNVKTAAFVNGNLNEADGANGYSTEAFVPWEAFGLEEAPEEMGVMPAFNNVSNREDTSRTWFSVKGMSHSLPTGYARVDATGFVDIGDKIQPAKALTAAGDDAAYASSAELKLEEVDKDNLNPETRATMKAFLGQDGAYFLAVVNDKTLTRGRDNIWENDGVELVIDSLVEGGGSISRSGILRIGVDVDGGTETDVTKVGYGDYIPMRRGVVVKTSVGEYALESAYGYRHTCVYEIMVPYASLGLTGKPASLSFAWAVKTPSEITYLFNRTDASGVMEGDSWLWADRHYPKNPSEYYLVTESGATGGGLLPDYEFPAWEDWADLEVRSLSPARYDYRGYTAQNGLYLNMVQFVDSYRRGGDNGDWEVQTHVEMEIWNEKIGYGMGGTYFAFFLNGTYYVNNRSNISEIQYQSTVTDRGADFDGFRYLISYEIYIGFNASGGATADVQLMSYTPNESVEGYENATTITKDGTRVLYTDDCLSYTVGEDGIFRRNLPYAFPDWSAHWQKPSTTDAPARYDYRAYMAADGFYLNMKQFVNSYVATGNGFDHQTHIELELWNDGVGWGAVTTGNSTYYAFFADGSTFENNATNRTQLQYKFTATENEAGAAYRYTLNYEVYIGFNAESRLTSAVQLYSGTPNEGTDYGNAISVNKDGTRLVWTEDAISLTVGTEGVAKKAYLPMQDWKDCAVQSDAPTRYNYQGATKADGLYLNVVQYVDNVADNDGNAFQTQTHIELNVYNASFNGSNRVFYGIFVNSPYYRYADGNANAGSEMYYHVDINDRGAEFNGFRYEVLYRIYVPFEAGSELTSRVQFMFYTPNETSKGYENSVLQVENDRNLYKDDCLGYTVGESGIAEKIAHEVFPDWSAQWAKPSVSDAPLRYDYRAYVANDGLYLTMVQYTNAVQNANGNGFSSKTHIEAQIYSDAFGSGAVNAGDFTYYGFYIDGSNYAGNSTNVTQLKYKVTVRERENEQYRFAITYEVFIGYAAGGDASVKMQLFTFTPGDGENDYDDAVRVHKIDPVRDVWTDDAISVTADKNGIAKKAYLPVKAWEDCAVQSDAPTRFNYQGATKADGLYLNVVQYVDNLVTANALFFDTHIEMDIYNTALNGTDRVFYAFSSDGTENYRYSASVTAGVEKYFRVKVTDRGDGYEGYRYEALYQIYVPFEAGSELTSRVQFYFLSPSEGIDGYENSVVKVETDRLLYTDDGDGYLVGENGITGKPARYEFPEWYEWGTEGTKQSQATSRYNYRGYTKADGFYINMVQYVDNIVANKGNWANTHVEFRHWNASSGCDGMFVACFLDGTVYLSHNNAKKNYSYRVTVTDRGAAFDGFRYMISYELFVGYANTQNYTYVYLMSCTPGESSEGYENALAVTWDNRAEWSDFATDSNKSYMFGANGVTGIAG